MSASVSGCAYTPSEKIISDSRWEITGNHPALPPATIFQVADCMQFTGIPLLGNYAITPGKNDDPLDGVSTYDLVKINKHILGLEPFANPYQIIAADANNSRTITTFDIIELRKLILGIYTEFPNNKSWRFIPKGYQFQNPANPFAEIFPEQIDLPNLMASVEQIDFTGIKTGDINGNTIDDSLQTAPATRTPIRLQLDDGFLRPSETVRMALHFDEELDLLGLQFALLFDPALLDISGLALSERLQVSRSLRQKPGLRNRNLVS